MSTTLSLDDDVYTGLWINRSLGKFQAATITLDQRWWNMMVSFVALFVAATSRSVWKLFRFASHLYYSVSTAEDGVHHQRHAVLRNTLLATDTAVQLIEIDHVWRGRALRSRPRLVTLFCVATIFSLSTTAASEWQAYFNLSYG